MVAVLAGLLSGGLSWAAPGFEKSIVGNWEWEGRQFYAFASDNTGAMSQDGGVWKFRWRVNGGKLEVTFLSDDGRELFTWQAAPDTNPTFLRMQTMPERPPVRLKRVPTIPFRRGFAASGG
jgi:hypothetical protein